MKTKKGDDILGYLEFTTPEFKLTSSTPKVINKGEVILCAEINLLDGTPNAGFEWRKVDAPDIIPSKRGESVVYDGKMEGLVKNLDTSSYYKVRPYYKATSGEEYFGEWIGFDPSDFSYFEPTVHTYDYVEIVDGVATLVGYAMQGSNDIISQGFEYWKDNTAHGNGFFAPSSGVKTVMATGQRMTAQVDGLAGGTTYGYRAFVKTIKGTTYGEEYHFTTPASNIEITHGDADGDGQVNVTDVMIIVEYILNRPNDKFNFVNADLDGNGTIDVNDVMYVVNIILHKSNVRVSPTAQQYDRDILCLAATETGCQLHTAFDAPTITALQMKVSLPDGCKLNNASLTGKAARTHQTMTHRLGESTYNVIVFSTKGAALDTDMPFLRFDLAGNGGQVEIEDILCTDTLLETLVSPSLSAEVTGIGAVTADDSTDTPIYNLSGQRISHPRKGVNIVNGKKMIVK